MLNRFDLSFLLYMGDSNQLFQANVDKSSSNSGALPHGGVMRCWAGHVCPQGTSIPIQIMDNDLIYNDCGALNIFSSS